MKISSKREYLVGLETAALTDIVLNMFIFFFISFSLLYTFSPYRIKQLDIKLPEAASTVESKVTDSVRITITNEGVAYLNNAVVTRKELKEKMRDFQKKNPEVAVALHADRLVHFKDVVGILDILTELGIKNLDIAAASE
jgi:biopolymer transport protein ExbD